MNEFGKKHRTRIGDNLKFTDEELDHVFKIKRGDLLNDIAVKNIDIFLSHKLLDLPEIKRRLDTQRNH